MRSLREGLLNNTLTLHLQSISQVEFPGHRGAAHLYLARVCVCQGAGVVTFREERELLLQVDEVVRVLRIQTLSWVRLTYCYR